MRANTPLKGVKKNAVGPTDASSSRFEGLIPSKAPGGPHRLRRGGIRTRFLWLLSVTFVPILLLLSWIYYERYQTRRDMEIESNLEIARAVGIAFQGFVVGVSRQELAIGNALVALTPFSTAQANHLLATSAAGYPAVEGFHWASPQARATWGTGRPMPAPSKWRAWLWHSTP